MTKEHYTALVMLFALLVLCPVKSMAQNIPPVADAGLSRYAAQDPVVLDGTGSYDPDESGPLSYDWRQVSGLSVVITDANTATPTVSGFTQTDEIQECEFELIVSDGELTSLPDTVKVIIVPDFGQNFVRHVNPPFDPNIPTFIFFGGGGCIGPPGQPVATPILLSRTNLIHFHDGYMPDVKVGSSRTYYGCADMIIVYLSSMAPDYRLPIQTAGVSSGGVPAVDVGIRLNLTYRDARYAVNRVTLLDASFGCRSYQDYSESIAALIASSVDGEQCWLDNYVSSLADFYPNVLNVGFDTVDHGLALWWYESSLTKAELNKFNNGVVAGGYWSVIGPGKNLQLASTPDAQTYKFKWYGSASSGYMDFYDETSYTGRLPEPVTLFVWGDALDPNRIVLTCKESENAVGYQLLLGPDPYRVMDYDIISDTSTPPSEVITTFPFEETWWTVRVRDQYGSTIYADPMRINSLLLSLSIENITTGKRYGYIQDAIDNAATGDEIVVKEGIYCENIDFRGKNLTVRSTDPYDSYNSAIVEATVINGGNLGSAVTFSSGEDANCVLDGFTITDANDGIYCYGASPTIINCKIVNNAVTGIKLYMGSNPAIANCLIANNGTGIEMRAYNAGRVTIFNYPIITNCTIAGNLQHGISGGIPTIINSIIWANSPLQIADSKGTFSATYTNVQGGWAGEGNIDADPLFAEQGYWINANNPNIIVEPSDPNAVWVDGDYHLKSQAGRYDPNSQTWVLDDVTSPCIDAGDPSAPVGLEPLPNGGIINMGAYGGTVQASKSP